MLAAGLNFGNFGGSIMSKFKPRTATVPIYQGDWQQRIGAAFAAAEAMQERAKKAEKAEASSSRTLDEASEALDLRAQFEELAAEHDALVAEAVESGDRLEVTLQAQGRRKWAELVEAYPPRTGDDVPEEVRKNDAEMGVNDKAFGEALVPLSIAAISDPEMSVDDLLDGISDAQFQLLYGTAFALNRAVGADPKAGPRLLPSQSSDATDS